MTGIVENDGRLAVGGLGCLFHLLHARHDIAARGILIKVNILLLQSQCLLAVLLKHPAVVEGVWDFCHRIVLISDDKSMGIAVGFLAHRNILVHIRVWRWKGGDGFAFHFGLIGVLCHSFRWIGQQYGLSVFDDFGHTIFEGRHLVVFKRHHHRPVFYRDVTPLPLPFRPAQLFS